MKCTVCSKEAVFGKAKCKSCQAYATLLAKKRRDRLNSRGLCYRCGTGVKMEGKGKCKECIEAMRVAHQERGHKSKSLVLSHYGPNGKMQCSWEGCNVAEMDGLTLDHINNDGAAQRQYNKREGVPLYAYLIKISFPEGFQTLCGTHQLIKKIRHERKTRQ